MRKLVSALVVFFALLVPSAVVVQTVGAPYVSGGEIFPLAGPINVVSPSNTTYDTQEVLLIVTSTYLLGPNYAEFCYSLDGANNVSIPLTGTQEPVEATRTYENGTTVVVNSTMFVPFTLNGETTLSNLTEGQHTLVIYANYTANNVIGYDETTVHFTINTDTNIASIPEFPSWAFLVVGAVTAAVLSTYFRRKIVR